MATLELDFDPRALASEIFQREALAYFAALPRPDPQYRCEQVAELLACSPDTVRAYLRLPAAHPRHLPHVPVSPGPKGRRIRLSAVQAWQERNDSRQLATPAVLAPKRAARRRAA